ncbi:MAG TPA: amino acid permease, partial [Casimicrobiaceae bacterium]|nr:amino acid permease [Casimicrobiaceae bacterium]
RFDAVAIVVGIVIGAGIYKAPSVVADAIGDPGWIIVAWLLGAFVSFVGALCYAELATAYPDAGGDYHFLTRAFGRDISFLYAWARASVINTGSIALLAFVFGDYLSTIVPFGAHSGAKWAALVVVALTAINVAGLRKSVRAQNALTTIEVAGLVAVTVAGLLVTVPGDAGAAPFATTPALSKAGLAMVFVLLTYGGWNEAAYISAEQKSKRAIAGALFTSIAIVGACYIAVNVALLRGLGLAGLAASGAPAADAMGRAFGPWGAHALALFVTVATLTSINATMIVGARSNYAIGRDWPALRFLGGWDALRAAPRAGYLFQGAVALALIAFGAFQHDGFEAMVNFTAPVFWGFLLLVGIALFVLRARDGRAERPFRVPLYPLTPLAFCAVCAFLFHSSVTYAISNDAVHISLLVMAVGVVVLLSARRLSRQHR